MAPFRPFRDGKKAAFLGLRVSNGTRPSHKAGIRRYRKEKVRRAHRAVNSVSEAERAADVAGQKHREHCKQARRWLQSQIERHDTGGVSETSHQQLLRFWKRADPKEMTMVKREDGEEELPDLDAETLGHWRRCMKALKEQRKAPQLRLFNTAMRPAELKKHKLKNKQDSRWISGRVRFPNRGGISIETENELVRFFKIEQPERQWKVVSKPGGVVEQVPNLTDESLDVWKRLQAERRKSRFRSSASDEMLLYAKRKDWWPKVQGLSEAEKMEKVRTWEEEGGWKDLEEFGLDSATKPDSKWDIDMKGGEGEDLGDEYVHGDEMEVSKSLQEPHV